MNCKGVIFDMDGLLFDTERVWQESWKEIAAELHVDLHEDFMGAIAGSNGKYMCDTIKKFYHVEDGVPIMTDCRERVRQKLTHSLKEKKGVHEILDFFQKEGLRIAVASSSEMVQIETNLKQAGIRDYFQEVVSGKDVKNGKPAQDIFVYAAGRIGCRPRECYVFEDSENGIRAGSAAGCVTIMIPDLFAPSEDIKPHCSAIYPDLIAAMEGIRDGK